MSDNYIQTWMGNKFFFDNIEESVIDIRDIAWSLAHTFRYNGHTSKPWSVGQHSLLVSDLCLDVTSEAMMHGLMHDAAEAYIGDMVGPLKRRFPEFKEIEQQTEDHIFNWFGISRDHKDTVKYADLQALKLEKENFMAEGDEWEILTGVVAPFKQLYVEDIGIVYNDFILRFESLLFYEPNGAKYGSA